MVDGLDETVAEDDAGRTTLAAGSQLGKYRLERVLGAGGMGIVWVARDPDLDREIAIKLLRSEHAPEALRVRLLREGRAMARLKHPNVLTVHEVASSSGRDYIVMELVDGTNLDAWLATHPEPRDVWDALFAAGRGLAAAHAAGLVHRDFKPHNVLRGRDGRVLVTDFGLARGLADEPLAGNARISPSGDVALDATLTPEGDTPHRTDSLLDSPLTQTGAMIGTPAYMSTEQLAGHAADARSDQFGFCVTAWQALAGKRPFEGTTLDELRAAATAGVANVAAPLPRAVRAVLARGLDPDPAKRWPDMSALLAALDRARHAPRRRQRIGIAAFAFAMAGVLGVKLALRAPAAARSPCEPDERAFARTWEATAETEAAAHVLDDLRGRWLASYRRACASPEAPGFNQRLGCLLATRDSIIGMLPIIDKFRNTSRHATVFQLLPKVDACDGAVPQPPPQLPDDPEVRAKIADIRVRALRLFGSVVPEPLDRLLEEARATSWQPLVPEVLCLGGEYEWLRGSSERARELLDRSAVEAAAARHVAIAARARMKLVSLDWDQALNPRDAGELARAEAEARAAIIAAGGSPVDLANVDMFAAYRAVFERHPETAIDELVRLRSLLLDAGDFSAIEVAELLSRSYQLRDRPGDRDAAVEVLRTTNERLRALYDPSGEWGLETSMAQAEFRRGNLDAAHRGGLQTAPYDLQPKLAGTVRGPDGAPVEGALVVAWSGSLEADSRRLYVSDVPGKWSTTDHDGRFEMLSRATAIVAEKGELRSRPQRVSDGTTLRLAPTHAIGGKVTSLDSPPVEVEAFAAMKVGGDRFVERAPVARDGSFQLARLPEGIEDVGARDESEEIRVAPADTVSMTWPALARLDVVVANAKASSVPFHVLRGKVAPRSRGELLALVDKASDVVASTALEIGDGDATDVGRALYQTGDRHRVLPHVDAGWITVCAIDGERFACVPYEVKLSHVTEKRYDDGTVRHWADANAVRIAF